jgi:cephalosporin hydroxylase
MTTFEETCRDYHVFLYNKFPRSPWRDFAINKNPIDCWKLQEVIWHTKPDLIIETGTESCASAHFFGDLCLLFGFGRVISVDTRPIEDRKPHPLVRYIAGDSVGDKVSEFLHEEIRPGDKVMADLDSDHRKEHVLKELDFYGPLVSPDCYMVVEDGNLNGHPVQETWGSGPLEALIEWCPKHPEFELDKNMEEQFGFTYFPMGWLKKKT